jgi:hypothetical protein
MKRKRLLGFAHRFRPTYALANVGHPSDYLLRRCDADSAGAALPSEKFWAEKEAQGLKPGFLLGLRPD